MATQILRNQVAADGLYDGMELEVLSTVVETVLVDGVDIVKTANREIWANGKLKYTVTLTNTTDIPMTNIVFTDVLDPDLIVLVPDSVYVNGTMSTYSMFGDILTVNLPDLPLSGTNIVEFEVVRA